jgi:RNA polymerase sigma factor (sigma-70 family)
MQFQRTAAGDFSGSKGGSMSDQFRNEFIETHYEYLGRIARQMRQPRFLMEDTLAEVSAALVSLIDKADDKTRTMLTENKKYRNRTFANLFRDANAKLTGRNNKQEKSEVDRVSLSTPIGDGIELGDMARCGKLNPERILRMAEVHKQLQKAFEQCSEDEKAVVDLSFGLEDGEELGQKEIATRLHISQGRVSQLLKSGLKKMRESRLLFIRKRQDRPAYFPARERASETSAEDLAA